jgi:hypothetical protein
MGRPYTVVGSKSAQKYAGKTADELKLCERELVSERFEKMFQ